MGEEDFQRERKMKHTNKDVISYIEEMKKHMEEKNDIQTGEENGIVVSLETISVAPIPKVLEVGSVEFKVAGLPKTTCSICQENKVRLRKKTPKKATRQYYENELGEAWCGSKCPQCFQKESRELMRKKRAMKT